VGGDVKWRDRLDWDRARWAAALERPGVETWVAYERGTPAGYIELDGQDDGVVEISYFGLIAAFRGRRVGGHLLTEGTRRAWDLAVRWPRRKPTRRVWVHTCSKDGPYALDNYRRRGFRVFDTVVEEEPARPTPGPWPGAFS
jgi:ribosomal protein S18 acetylase RimI-like enzyme